MRSLRWLRHRKSWVDGEARRRVFSSLTSSLDRCSDDASGRHALQARWCGLAGGLILAGSIKQEITRCDEGDHHHELRLTPKDLEPLLKPSADNPIPVSLPPPMPGLAGHQWSRHRHVAPIFGLPMRGKTYLAAELARYIEFFHGARAKVFDINAYLGENGDDELLADLVRFFEADAAESDDVDALKEDTKANYSGGFAIISCSNTVESTRSIWSAHTKFNRRWMAKTLEKQLGAQVCFIQVTVEDSEEAVKYTNLLMQRRGKTPEQTKEVVSNYADHYVPLQKDERQTPYIELMNYNEAMIVNRVMQTFVGARVCQFLANTHPYEHTIFLSRHGESEYNVQKRLGGNSSLSRRGQEFARRVGEFSRYMVTGRCKNLVCVTLTPAEVQSLGDHVGGVPDYLYVGGAESLYSRGEWSDYGDASGAVVKDGMQLVRIQPGYGEDFVDAPSRLDEVMQVIGTGPATLVFVEGDISASQQVPARLWHSSLNRTIETAAFIPHPVIEGPDGKPWKQMDKRAYRNLDEVYAGVYDGFSEEEIKLRDPQSIRDRKRDKLGFRYPRGESYYDIIARLDDVMTNLERIREPILIVSHQAVLRLILAWLTEKAREDALPMTFPQHGVMKICFDGLGGERSIQTFQLGPARFGDDGQGNF